jgi:hypothetical protein
MKRPIIGERNTMDELDQTLLERDEAEDNLNRILYTFATIDEIGEWSNINDPVERFIELMTNRWGIA